jgi:arabinogalactan oligomer/maltooligosaccharide transport system substrate-binding protein
MTADNGYFMFYNKEYFSEDDVKSLDTMMQVAADAGKKVSMEVTNGWYIYSFFQGAGLGVGLSDDGVTNYCEWDAEGGTDVAQAILDICANPGFVTASDAEFATGIAEGTIIAGVNGTWRAEDAAAAWGDNYAATKLPTFTVNGEQVQMSSYSGCKLIGVNPHSSNIGWSMLLAEYLTNEDAQIARFEGRGLGPANIEAASSEAVQASPAVAALAEQAEYATPQRVGGNYWEPAATLGTILAQGNTDGTDLQTLLTNAVDGITQPPVTE